MLLGRYTGTIKTTQSYIYDDATSWSGSGTSSLTVWRGDLDSTLNYSLNRYFKVFGGLKCMYMSYSFDSSTTLNKGVGPGLGFSASLPVMDNFFALFNLSGLYLRNVLSGGDDGDMWFNVYGVNSSLSLAYYFPSLNLTASAGVRYQQLRYMESTANTGVDNTDDKFYGLVLSLIYTF